MPHLIRALFQLTSCQHRENNHMWSARWLSTVVAWSWCRPNCWHRWWRRLREYILSSRTKFQGLMITFSSKVVSKELIFKKKYYLWCFFTCWNILGGYDGELATLEDDSAVRRTRMIEKTRNQVDPGTKVFWSGGSEKLWVWLSLSGWEDKKSICEDWVVISNRFSQETCRAI